jgi:prepilin-type N-terminal cleavage/methylation domain-containing protein
MKRQRGFTLIELLMSATAASVIMVAASSFMVRALGWHDELSAKLEMNRHARETWRVLAYGGKGPAAGRDGTNYVYGVRGRKNKPGRGMRSEYAFEYTSNHITLAPDRSASMMVTCTGSGQPVPGCGASGSTKRVEGWMAADVDVDDKYTVANETVEIEMTVMSPYQIQRAKDTSAFKDSYRAIFTLNRMENDP